MAFLQKKEKRDRIVHAIYYIRLTISVEMNSGRSYWSRVQLKVDVFANKTGSGHIHPKRGEKKSEEAGKMINPTNISSVFVKGHSHILHTRQPNYIPQNGEYRNPA